MSNRDKAFYREIILEHVAAIKSYLPETEEALVSDAKTYDAILMRLMAIGEELGQAKGLLPEHVPGAEWHKIIGLRNRIAHGYWEVDKDSIWELLTDGSLEKLESSLEE